MERSESIAKLAEALAKAQTEIGIAAFDSKNPHFNSKYASLAAVAEAAKPLAAHGIAVLQPASTRRDEKGVMVVVKTILAHSSGEWIADEIAMKPAQDTPQAIGSALTYGRRYLLASFVGIASDEDDDGNAATDPRKTATKPTPKPTRPEPKIEAHIGPAPVEPKAAKIHTVELPADPKPAEPQKTAEAATTGAEMASLRKAARDAAIKAGIRDREECFGVASAAIGRAVTDWSDLSADELRKAREHFDSIAEMQKEAA